MSYILDALKKSERARTLVRGVGFGDAGRQPPRDLGWLYWLGGGVAAAIVVAGVVLVWQRGAPVEHASGTAPVARDTTPARSPESSAAIPAQVGGATSAPLEQVAIQSPPKPVSPAVSRGPVKWLSAMPAEFQRQVPPMIVNIHVYAADESRRILYINNRQFHQGDEIPGGVVVEQIVPEGVVLQYQGQRFRLPRPS